MPPSLTRKFCAVAALAVTLGSAQAAELDPQPLKPQLQQLIAQMYPQMRGIYEDLHANPELGFQETRTAAKLAAEMRRLGFEVTEGIGKTGLVAIYRNGAGPTVMVRTELDALPMEEKTGLPYASRAKAQYNGKESFVAHSCGHDMHMTSWLGTAQALLGLKRQWKGTLMFVAQPSEETVTGAKAMLADGLFQKFGKPDYAFALHTGSMPYGTVGYVAGAATSNSDSLDITFHGRGSHGSMPDKGIDPVLMASRFVVDVQGVVSREKDPMEFGVVTVGAFNAGSAGNIIPDQARLLGTIRSYKSEVRSKLHDGIERSAKAQAAMSGAPAPEIKLTKGSDAVVNDAALVNRTVRLFKAALGDKNVLPIPPATASEDFSDFINQGVPSMFYILGVSDPQKVAQASQPGGKPLPFNHSPFFAPEPEPTFKTGVETMTLAVMNVMQ
ncbi:amidohydrolase [Comamonas testosteroni]|uniref:Amidohydrolase n=1 Tax=Comamonas testosteroni (strain DSM 14576 / KF-1) TaxID=399795 RepID=B7WS86_COMTK|nr:amidohydrolase [Comamonas testosteroni]EED65344.1 amidohydrolase [Comamonas testosteroni KF-1]WQG68755.1 amidohydrolase [Comamonas testosteroni]